MWKRVTAKVTDVTPSEDLPAFDDITLTYEGKSCGGLTVKRGDLKLGDTYRGVEYNGEELRIFHP